MKKQKTFIIIDGNAILHRAWHALPPTLMTKDGLIVNAVFGFTSILLKVFSDLKPDFIAVAWDTAAKTVRAEKYVDYKATREKKEQELYDQIELIQEIVAAFAIPNLMKDGYEADDMIATLAKRAKKEGLSTIIVTGDMDLLQLVDESTFVYALKKGISQTILFDRAAVKERYGLSPLQIIDYKALKGDPSDNIKGVKGIGEKSAIELLQQFETVEGIYEAIESGKTASIKPAQLKKLVDGKKDALLSKEIVTLYSDVPCKFTFEEAAFGRYNLNDVFELFQRYEFRSLLSRVPKPQQALDFDSSAPKTAGYVYVTTPDECDKVAALLKQAKAFAFDTETTGYRPLYDEMLGLSVSFEEEKAFYIHAKAVTDALKGVFADSQIKKIAHQARFDLEVLMKAGFEINNLVFDTKIAAYLLNPGSTSTGLKDLAFEEFGVQMTKLEDLLGKGKNALTMPQLAEQKSEQLAEYAAADADFTFRLWPILAKRLKEEGLETVFAEIEIPLIRVLVDIEQNGVVLDKSVLAKLAKTFRKRMDTMEEEIYTLSKGEFNINSPRQLAEVLFDRLGLPTEGIKKTKSGYSTAASELDKLAPLHPLISLIGDYRELAKLKSTYIDSLPELIHPKTGRVHGSFHQTVAATGRLSSSDPNLQNIPIRTEEGKKIREAFIAPKGYYLLSCDYSQFELRIVASLAQDPEMIDAFKKGEDIHRRTAALINEIKPEQVTDAMRYAAKAVNFGIIYGQGPWGLSQTAKIPLNEAKMFIEKYFKKHAAIERYLDKAKADAKKKGYAQTMFGRKRYLPEINSSVPAVRAAAERMAINMPIQGSQADILKMAMIQLHEALKSRFSRDEVRMILTVHDELVFEVKKERLKEAAQFIREAMEHPKGVKLKVPMKVDAEFGENWGEMQPVAF